MFSQTTLIGHVGQDPEVNTVGDDARKLARFTLATRRVWYNRSREKQEETTWHRINVVNSKIAEIVEKYVQKGNLLTVVGRIQKREYEHNGEQKTSYEIVLDFDGKLVLMPRATNDKDQPTKQRGTADAPAEMPQDFDDDIPF